MYASRNIGCDIPTGKYIWYHTRKRYTYVHGSDTAKECWLFPKMTTDKAFSHDVTAAILVFQNNETAAMWVYQDNRVGDEFFSFAKKKKKKNWILTHIHEENLRRTITTTLSLFICYPTSNSRLIFAMLSIDFQFQSCYFCSLTIIISLQIALWLDHVL